MHVKSDRFEQARETRQALLRQAARMFAEVGYADTSTNELVRRAGMTKGALYHHFTDKRDLYEAVVEDLERRLSRALREAGARAGADPWKRLDAMCSAYLDAAADREVGRILMLEAPVVLGWRRWCELAREHEAGAFVDALEEVVGSTRAPRQPSDLTAQVLLGALNTAGRVVATADDHAAARAQVEQTVSRLLAGLRTRRADGG